MYYDCIVRLFIQPHAEWQCVLQKTEVVRQLHTHVKFAFGSTPGQRATLGKHGWLLEYMVQVTPERLLPAELMSELNVLGCNTKAVW